MEQSLREYADWAEEENPAGEDPVAEMLRTQADEPGTCVCDARLVGQALDNLVENAIRYSGSKDIVLSLAHEGNQARIAVEDHGTGIPPEHRARIFERFYRVDKARSRAQGGTGLGLAIVKHVALLHGGEATLAEAEGGGCRFTLTLPLKPNNETTDKKGKEAHT